MRHQRRFNLRCPHAVAGHIQHIIDTAGDPEIAIRVASRAIAREIPPRKGGEIGFDETLMVAIDGPHLPRPGPRDAQIAINRTIKDIVVSIDKHRLDAKERACRRARLGRRGTGKRCDQNPAGFGLPPGIDNWTTAIANNIMIPHPGFRIDRLTDTAKKPQRGAVASLYRCLALAHQRPDGGRCGVEDVDLMFLDNLPEARAVGPGRHTLEHQRDRAIGKRSIDYIAVAGDPTDIGGTPVDVAIMIIEDILMGHRGIDHIAAGGVQNTLRLAG